MGKQTANMQLTASQFDTVYNVTSFGLACMMASTAFFFLRLGSMTERYQEALCYTGLGTFIAFYHYYRIFNSFDAAFTRWTYWTLSMLPFCYIVYTLFVGLKESQDAQ